MATSQAFGTVGLAVPKKSGRLAHTAWLQRNASGLRKRSSIVNSGRKGNGGNNRTQSLYPLSGNGGQQPLGVFLARGLLKGGSSDEYQPHPKYNLAGNRRFVLCVFRCFVQIIMKAHISFLDVLLSQLESLVTGGDIESSII